MQHIIQVPDDHREQELCRLMDAYGSMLMGVCMVLLRDRPQAEDIVQETFLKAWQADGLRRETEKAWLVRVAVNRCRDHLRSRWFRLVDRSHPVEELPLSAPAPEDHALLQQVMGLPLEEREVIMMHYFSDMPAEEIAAALHVNRATVYRRLERARKHLRIELEGGRPLD